MLLFAILALSAWHIDSPWWDGPVLKLTPVLPEPTGGFVKKTTDETVEDVAKVDLAPKKPPAASGGPTDGPTDRPTDGPTDSSRDGEDGGKDATDAPARPTSAEAVGYLNTYPDPDDFELLDKIRSLESQLEKPPTRLERPCRAWSSPLQTGAQVPYCTSRVMDGFFEQLRRVSLGRAERPLRYTQFGDSLIAGDGFTGELRRLLHDQFGDGGFGYVHMGKASRFIGTRHLTTRTSEDWKVSNVILDGPRAARFGFGGVAFEPDGSPYLRIYPHDEGTGRAFDRVGILYWRPHRKLSVQMRVDGETRRVDLSGPRRSDALTWVDVGDGPHRLSLNDFREGVYYGVVLENKGPGTVVDNLGLMNGRAPRLSLIDEAVWQKHIRLRGPDLVSFAYGVNSAGRRRASSRWLDRYSAQYADVLRTVRDAPEDETSTSANRTYQDCMVLSVLTRGTLEGDEVEVYPSVEPLIRHQGRAAREAGCAFWNAFEAIGGRRGVDRWYHNRPQLLGSDFSHPTGAGYKKLANLFYASLIEGFRQYLEERIHRASHPNLRDAYVDQHGDIGPVPPAAR